MKFSQFRSSIEEQTMNSKVVASTWCYNHFIQETLNGIFVDRDYTDYKSIDEAVIAIRNQNESNIIYEQLQYNIQEDLNENHVIELIKEYSSQRVTDTLVENYIHNTVTKKFSIDPVLFEIRKYNKINNIIEDRLDYILDDGSIVVISENMQQKINNLFNEHKEIVDYMKENKDNFLNVVNQIEE